jgi:hypothetical protein
MASSLAVASSYLLTRPEQRQAARQLTRTRTRGHHQSG